MARLATVTVACDTCGARFTAARLTACARCDSGDVRLAPANPPTRWLARPDGDDLTV